MLQVRSARVQKGLFLQPGSILFFEVHQYGAQHEDEVSGETRLPEGTKVRASHRPLVRQNRT